MLHFSKIPDVYEMSRKSFFSAYFFSSQPTHILGGDCDFGGIEEAGVPLKPPACVKFARQFSCMQHTDFHIILVKS